MARDQRAHEVGGHIVRAAIVRVQQAHLAAIRAARELPPPPAGAASAPPPKPPSS